MFISKTTAVALAMASGMFLTAGVTAQAQTTRSVDGDVDVADWALQAAGRAAWLDLETCTILEAPRSASAVHVQNIWTDGEVFYVFHGSVAPDQQQNMLDAMAEIESVSDVQFIPHMGEPNYVLIRRSESGCSATTGMAGGIQFVNLTAGCFTDHYLIIHELMHTLGMRHEQTRNDRDDFVEINWDAINPGAVGNFIIQPNMTDDGPYNFDSVTHYRRTAWHIDGDWTISVRDPYKRLWQRAIGNRDHLSHGDMWVLYHLYGGGEEPDAYEPPPGPFELDAPTNGALVGASWMPEFSWGVAELADSYRLVVDDDGLAVDHNGLVVGGGGLSPEIDVTLSQEQTSYEHGMVLPANRLYHWTVIAGNATGDSPPFHFRTGSFYTSSQVPDVLYVDDDAPPGGSGASWAEAMRDLQNALVLAEGTGLVSQVRVAQGLYSPDYGSGHRKSSFSLVSGVQVLGGYAGTTEPDPDARDPAVYISTLSGDLLADDQPDFVNNEENSYAVVEAIAVDSTTVLDGFVISGGNADNIYSSGYRAGGGIHNDAGSAVIRNCVFTTCSAAFFGGSMYDAFHGSLALEGCTFTDNTAAEGGGAQFWQSNPTVTDCTFSRNTVSFFGGGISCIFNSNPTITGCTFQGNSSELYGGAMDIELDSNPTLTNCRFNGNSAFGAGGALWFGPFCLGCTANPTLTNCTISNNTAGVGGGIYSTDAFGGHAAPKLRNCIVWNNSPDEIVDVAGAVTTVRYSDVQGGWPGKGNIDADPLLVNAAGGDLHLSPGSPCIDAADSTAVPSDTTDLDDDGDTDEPIPFDLDGNPRFVNDLDTQDTGVSEGGCPVVDMGTYEHQEGTEECCPADLSGDGVVEAFDLGILLGGWGPCPEPCKEGDPEDTCPADLSGDCVVEAFDLAILLGAWGPCQ